MQIINNRTRKNHKVALLESFKKADSIIITSPFLASNFDFFPFNKVKHVKEISLITTLKSINDDQRNKVKFFRKLIDFGKKTNTTIRIQVDNSLHGKLYITKIGSNFNQAIITSANFTSNGLWVNNEWGISIDSHEEILNIVGELNRNIRLEQITENKLLELEKKLNTIPQKKTIPSEEFDLSSLLSFKEDPLIIPDNINYWLKPIGAVGHIITWDSKFDQIDTDLHFSDKYPRSVKQGDILISYAVGHKNILSIYRVKSKVNNTGNQGDRWPYYVVGENLTPFYGSDWNNYNITISNQKQEVINAGLFNITPSGKNSFGSLMRGADKLRITKEFANFLIEKVLKIDDEISMKTNNIS